MITRILVIGVALLVSGCSFSTPKVTDLGRLYNRSAQNEDLARNPVVVIPGILGSTLVDSENGRTVWGAFTGEYANPDEDEGARMVALPMATGKPFRELRDKVRPAGVLENLHLAVFGLPIELSAYSQILGTLGAGGYRDENLGMSGAIDYGTEHFTCFQFPYDWRRDLTETVELLDTFLLEKRKFVQKKFEELHGVKDHPVKFDIVAHSMGGLLTRYYLRYGTQPLPEDGSLPKLTWAGAKNIERAVLIGTPNGGSLQALRQLLHGTRFARIFPRYEAALLGTMPSLYQLMPRVRHGSVINAKNLEERVNIFDPQVWIKNRWGLVNPSQDETLKQLLPGVTQPKERYQIALEHLTKSLALAEQFHRAIDLPATPPPGTSLSLIAGDAEHTPAVAKIDSSTGSYTVQHFDLGDGTVLRSSALMDERVGQEWTRVLQSPIVWDQVTFLFRNHLDLTKDPTFTDNILFLLLEKPK